MLAKSLAKINLIWLQLFSFGWSVGYNKFRARVSAASLYEYSEKIKISLCIHSLSFTPEETVHWRIQREVQTNPSPTPVFKYPIKM